MLIIDPELDGLVAAFVDHVTGARPIETKRRAAYFESLNSVQKYRLHFQHDRCYPNLTVNLNSEETQAVIRSLLASEEMRGFDTIEALPSVEFEKVARCVGEALEMLRAYNPTAGRYVTDLVGEIIFIHKRGVIGGSFWHLLGAIWMSPDGSWNIPDWAESLLHESVHQSMFLTDMVHGLFRCSEAHLRSPSMLVMSPIRGVRRPLDAAFHAATVAATLVDFHEWTGLQARAHELCVPLLATLTELHDRRDSFTEMGQLILDRMVEVVGQSRTLKALRENVPA